MNNDKEKSEVRPANCDLSLVIFHFFFVIYQISHAESAGDEPMKNDFELFQISNFKSRIY